jgi:type II secretory pathway component PulJ
MSKVQSGMLALLIAGGALLFVLQYRETARLHAENQALAQQLAQGQELQTANEKLSRDIEQASAAAKDSTSELLKLRSEVTALRRQTNEVERLREQNRQLAARQESADAARRRKTPPDVPPQDIHPRENWQFAGYATPDAAIESTAWAFNQTNVIAFLNSFAGDARKEMENDLKQRSLTDMLAERARSTGFRILRRDAMSDNKMVMRVFSDGEDDAPDGGSDYTFERIDGLWKITKD